MKNIDNYENIIRGNSDFPIEFYYVDEENPKYEMNLHWHIDAEIIFVEEGSLYVQLNNEFITLNAGDILYVSSNTLHGAVPQDCVYDCIVFNEKLLFKNPPVILKEASRFPCSLLSGDEYAVQTAKSIIFYSKRMENGDTFRILSCIYGLYSELYNAQKLETTLQKQNSRSIEILKTAIEIIENEYSTPLTLKRLARACGLSEGYFCSVFKSLTGKTPFEYLTIYRIEAACELMEQGNMTITEISLLCGFNDLSYFIKTFKKYKNRTPYKYASERRTDLSE